MAHLLNLTDEEREQFGRRIENGPEFVREILNDPTILDHIPNGANVRAIPKDERDADRRYDIETPRMLPR